MSYDYDRHITSKPNRWDSRISRLAQQLRLVIFQTGREFGCAVTQHVLSLKERSELYAAYEKEDTS
jgi:hypothetical protein